MTFNHYRLEGTPSNLYGCAKRGDLTMPKSLMDISAEFDQWTDENPKDRAGIDKRVEPVVTAWSRFNPLELITDHIQPAMAEVMAEFTADVALLGKYLTSCEVPIAVVTESEEVRLAYVRAVSSYPRYASIRACWERVVGATGGGVHDPNGVRSPLGEVANMPELVADWEKCMNGRATWPWQHNVHFVRLAWIVTNGGRVWCPTGAEWNNAYARYRRVGSLA